MIWDWDGFLQWWLPQVLSGYITHRIYNQMHEDEKNTRDPEYKNINKWLMATVVDTLHWGITRLGTWVDCRA